MRLAACLGRIEHQLELTEKLIPRVTGAHAEVSGWSIGQHLDHCLQVDRSILDTISDPPDVKELPPLKMVGRIILATGWIPRGKGRAPAKFEPQEVSTETISSGLSETRELLSLTAAEPERLAGKEPIAAHFYFGGFTPAQWLRFLEVHQNHHLKIVADIERRIG